MNNTDSHLKSFSQVDPIQIPKERTHFSSIDKEYWTTEKLIDELIYCLCGSKSHPVNEKTVDLQIRSPKCYEQAQFLFYRIPGWKPTPPFVICLEDLTPKIIKELEELQRTNPQVLQYVLKMAVGAIFENIDLKYYHRSVARNLKVKFSRCHEK
jgi:hypothetical protein